jgi:transcriptional regulator
MGIELSFADTGLRDTCENIAKAKRTFGKHLAEKVYSRLLDLKACKSLKEFPFEIYDHGNEKYISIDSTLKVFFTHNHISPPKKNQTKIEWNDVKRIKILRIEESKYD